MFRLFTAAKAFFTVLLDPKAAERLSAISLQKAEHNIPPLVHSSDREHLRLLALLQQHARLIDFLQEDLSPLSDEQVGAVARQIYTTCREKLEEFVTIRPLISEEEGSTIIVPSGYDPIEIKVIGNVKGEPPYKGILRHPGWKAHKVSLPKQAAGDYKREILAPAEVEVL